MLALPPYYYGINVIKDERILHGLSIMQTYKELLLKILICFVLLRVRVEGLKFLCFLMMGHCQHLNPEVCLSQNSLPLKSEMTPAA